ncbi:MAG: PilZ protein, partial [Pseudomonadota bacterium]|nr:PilZ protein [Pseudomonadota bacterium]
MTEQTEAAGNQGAGSEVTSENRRHTRYRVNLPVHIKLSTGEVARARAVDISTDSVYVEYGAPADEGKIFEMLFDLPFSSDFRRVYVKGKVVRAVIIGDRNV